MSRQRSPVIKICATCSKKIEDKILVSCRTPSCLNVFHVPCVPSYTVDQKTTWKCPECQCLTKKGNDKPLTPVRAISDNNIIENVSAINVHESNACSGGTSVFRSEISELTAEFRLLRDEVTSIKAHLADGQSEVRERLDALSTHVTGFGTRLRAVEDRMPVITSMTNTILELQERLDIQLQANLRNEVEFIGVPEQPQENLVHLVLTSAAKIGIEMNESDIDYVSRAGTFRVEMAENRHLPRPVVVRFLRRSKRNEFLKNAKVRRHLQTQDLELSGHSQKIYINERLTRENRLLFRDARRSTKEAGFKYCWTSNGTVYIRRKEGAGAIAIRTRDDLAKLAV